jgi:ankyrin repeat protein
MKLKKEPCLFRISFICLTVLFCGCSQVIQIHEAARSGDVKKVEALTERNSSLAFSKDSVGSTPLHEAALKGQTAVVKFLLAHHAEVNTCDMYGQTPLFDAAMNGHMEAAKLLLLDGADINIKDNEGQTPLHKAAWGGYTELVKFLLAKGADINAKDNNGMTPLREVELKGRDESAALLRQSGGN